MSTGKLWSTVLIAFALVLGGATPGIPCLTSGFFCGAAADSGNQCTKHNHADCRIDSTSSTCLLDLASAVAIQRPCACHSRTDQQQAGTSLPNWDEADAAARLSTIGPQASSFVAREARRQPKDHLFPPPHDPPRYVS